MLPWILAAPLQSLVALHQPPPRHASRLRGLQAARTPDQHAHGDRRTVRTNSAALRKRDTHGVDHGCPLHNAISSPDLNHSGGILRPLLQPRLLHHYKIGTILIAIYRINYYSAYFTLIIYHNDLNFKKCGSIIFTTYIT